MDEEDIAALVIDNGSGMCKGKLIKRVHICARYMSGGVSMFAGPQKNRYVGDTSKLAEASLGWH
jgi:hypothetical protein